VIEKADSAILNTNGVSRHRRGAFLRNCNQLKNSSTLKTAFHNQFRMILCVYITPVKFSRGCAALLASCADGLLGRWPAGPTASWTDRRNVIQHNCSRGSGTSKKYRSTNFVRVRGIQVSALEYGRHLIWLESLQLSPRWKSDLGSRRQLLRYDHGDIKVADRTLRIIIPIRKKIHTYFFSKGSYTNYVRLWEEFIFARLLYVPLVKSVVKEGRGSKSAYFSVT